MLQQLGRTRSDLTERREAAHQQQKRVAEAGFTLIELLIVIVILGILAAVVVFSVRGITDKGQGAACQADFVTVQNAEEAAYAQGGNYLTMADLALKGFLAHASQYFDATTAGSTKGYTISDLSGAQYACTATDTGVSALPYIVGGG